MASYMDQLKSGDQPFTKDPAQSFTMPARVYVDPDVLAAEKQAIFFKTWHYAGHVSQVAEKKSYFTTEIQDQGIFIARGGDDVVRAFHNVCAHRGHELLQGSGRKPVITCPYHAWSYEFDERW